MGTPRDSECEPFVLFDLEKTTRCLLPSMEKQAQPPAGSHQHRGIANVVLDVVSTNGL